MKKIVDSDVLKANIKYILILLVLGTCLIVFDIYSNKSKTEKKELKDEDISYHSLVINEIMSSNSGAYIDENGNTDDWLEIYNGTSKEINLKDYGLSDDVSGRVKWKFPNITIKSNEYLVVFLSGKKESGLHASFALSKNGGETITLKNPNGKVVDSVKVVEIEKNSVMARDSSGKWFTTDEITPGFSNNKEGRQNYLKGTTNDELVKITEILPSNKGIVLVDGRLIEYVEIKNESNETINLEEYYLSDDENLPYKWKLPKDKLKSDESYLITNKLDGMEKFSLKNKNGKLLLSHKQSIVDSVEYKDLPNGYAYILVKDKYIETTNISPGFNNDNDGASKFNELYRKNKKDLIINEAMNNNTKYLAQNGNQYYDWIELYNNSGKKIKLSDYSLTNNDENKKLYKLPDIELDENEYYVIMLSGNTEYSNKEYKHANFKLSGTESIYLYKDNELVDSIYYTNVPNGYSYGRGKDSGLYYFEKPTPNKKNDSGILEISFAPTFDKNPGAYDEKKISLSLNGLGTIYYTLDGSNPNKSSKVYNSPLILEEPTVVKMVAYQEGRKVSEVITGTYIVGKKHTLPVLSISLPSENFRTLNNNLSSNITVQAHAELYEKDKSFNIDCGMKLFGGQTRYIPKKSFALKFSKKYGPSSLNYKVFENRDAVKYDTVVVRSGSQDSVGSMIRDELATSIMDKYGTVDVQAYKAVVLYINGDYRGVYFLREKVDEEFVSHHYNVPESGTNIVRVDNVVSAGSSRDYDSLRNYISSHDMTSNEAYEYVSSKLDIDNYIDFLIGEIYTTNNDIVNMRYFNNKALDNGKLKMVFYDFDYAFYNFDRNYLRWLLDSEGLGLTHYNNTIIIGLFKNNKFKKRFLERASYNMKNVWSEENINKEYDYLVKLIEPEMRENQKRWNHTYGEWQVELRDLKTYLEKRRKYMLSSIKNYFGLSDKEMKEYFE